MNVSMMIEDRCQSSAVCILERMGDSVEGVGV